MLETAPGDRLRGPDRCGRTAAPGRSRRPATLAVGVALAFGLQLVAFAPSRSAEPAPEPGEVPPDDLSLAALCALRVPHGRNSAFFLAAGGNAVFPGLGYFVNDHSEKGIRVGLVSAGLLGGALLVDARSGETTLRNNLLVLYQNLGFLTAWDVYRQDLAEATYRRTGTRGDRPPLAPYLLSPFDGPSVRSLEWLVPSALVLTAGVVHVADAGEGERPIGEAAGVEALLFAQSVLIGTGEELMFRGVLQAELQSWTGSRTTALIGQAVAFGAGHIDPEESLEENAARMGFATTFGLYAGWLASSRPDGLRKAIAIHAWWDALVFSADYLADGSTEPLWLSFGF